MVVIFYFVYYLFCLVLAAISAVVIVVVIVFYSHLSPDCCHCYKCFSITARMYMSEYWLLLLMVHSGARRVA